MSFDNPMRLNGYRLGCERYDVLQRGFNAKALLASVSVMPSINIQADPLENVSTIEDQGQIGSCVGNSGSTVTEICYFLATGRKIQLSRAAAYYLSQKADGIRGDNGATMSGFREAITGQGLPEEIYWPYVPRYNPTQPSSAEGKFLYKLRSTSPITTIADFDAWIEKGLPIHAGLPWNDSADQDVVDSYNPDMRNSGGHAIAFWLKNGNNFRMLNSWGKQWRGGQNVWTRRAIEIALRHRYATFIGFAPDDAEYPQPGVI